MVYTYSYWILTKYSKSKLKQALQFKCVFKTSLKHVGRWDLKFEELLKNTCFSFHLIIVHCDPSETCSGHGTCQEDGSCKCSDGFYGVSCSSKSIYHLSWFWANLAVQTSWILWVFWVEFSLDSKNIVMLHKLSIF